MQNAYFRRIQFMNIHYVRFRPGSHSSDLTVVFTYSTSKAAREGARKLRWINKAILSASEKLPENSVDWHGQFVIRRKRKEVLFHAFTDGELNIIKRSIQSAAQPLKVEDCYNYQELTIAVTLPQEASARIESDALAMIIDPDEARAIRWLNQHCGAPRVTGQGSNRKLTWQYSGEHIFSADRRRLFLDQLFQVDTRPNWKIKRHPWTLP
jgi:hypothetical protein